MLKPVDIAHEVTGRSFTELTIAAINLKVVCDGIMCRQATIRFHAEDAGDGFLFRLGYTIVDAGWQGDVSEGNDRLFPDLPIAQEPRMDLLSLHQFG